MLARALASQPLAMFSCMHLCSSALMHTHTREQTPTLHPCADMCAEMLLACLAPHVTFMQRALLWKLASSRARLVDWKLAASAQLLQPLAPGHRDAE